MTLRLFFALWPSDGLQLAIDREVRELVTRCGGQPVPQTNFHATLAFLGAVTDELLPVLRVLAENVRVAQFALKLDHAHGWQRSGILFLGTDHVPAELTQLVEELQNTLRERGFALEDRPFRLHVTLARGARLKERVAIRPIEWRVNEFALVQSTAGRGGSRYQVIGRWPLRKSD